MNSIGFNVFRKSFTSLTSVFNLINYVLNKDNYVLGDVGLKQIHFIAVWTLFIFKKYFPWVYSNNRSRYGKEAGHFLEVVGPSVLINSLRHFRITLSISNFTL